MPESSIWTNQRVLVTGGASFIGSHLVDALTARGASIRVVDDLTSGRLESLQCHLANGRVEFSQADLREPGVARMAMQGIDTVFHLAADHGGRGYVDLHQAGPASNFLLDGLVFAEALKAKVKKVVFASSGCVYPNYLQADVNKGIFLTEDLTKGPNDADNTYGWAKLMGEFTLQAYAREHGLKAASCRYFTVYGPHGVENHAVIAMIARAFLRQSPFEVWGDGCLPAGECVISNPGIKPIAEVHEGDSVLGADGQYNAVLREMSRPYVGDLITIKPLGVHAVRLTSEHPVLVARLRTKCNVLGKDEPHWCKPNCWCLDAKYRYHHHPHDVVVERVWVSASDVRPYDFILIPRVKREEPQIVDLPRYAKRKCSAVHRRRIIPLDEDFAYFLGWYTAEGWTNWQRNKHNAARKAKIALALGLHEETIVKRIASCISKLGFRPQIRKRTAVYEISFSSTHLARWLDDHVGKGAYQKRVAQQLFLSTQEIIEIYLDALFCGDGWRAKYVRKLTSVSRILLEGVQILLAKVGRFGWINWCRRSNSGFGGSIHQGIIAYSEATQRQYWIDAMHVYVPVREVSRESFEGTVYNIETVDATFCSPFVIHNSQIRNWTYIDDIVSGTILAGERIDDGTAVNLGTMERIRVIDAARLVLEYTGHKAEIKLRPDMPTGPLNRVADNSLAKKLLGWEPKVPFREGLRRTVEWYFKTKDCQQVRATLNRMLTER